MRPGEAFGQPPCTVRKSLGVTETLTPAVIGTSIIQVVDESPDTADAHVHVKVVAQHRPGQVRVRCGDGRADPGGHIDVIGDPFDGGHTKTALTVCCPGRSEYVGGNAVRLPITVIDQIILALFTSDGDGVGLR